MEDLLGKWMQRTDTIDSGNERLYVDAGFIGWLLSAIEIRHPELVQWTEEQMDEYMGYREESCHQSKSQGSKQ